VHAKGQTQRGNQDMNKVCIQVVIMYMSITKVGVTEEYVGP